MDSIISKKKFLTSENILLNKRVARPDPKEINPKEDNFIFMQIDVDSDVIGQNYNLEYEQQDDPILRMYGINAECNSVCLLIENFFPYFYIMMPLEFTRDDISNFRIHLVSLLNNAEPMKSKLSPIITIEIVDKIPIFGYHKESANFLKITVRNMKCLSVLREAFERGMTFNSIQFDRLTYESKLNFPLRYMIDNGIVGMSWVELPKNHYKERKADKISNCQYEFIINYKHIISHKPEGEFSKIPPMRILSFDIECAEKFGHFPKAETDPVIQIANICTEFGNKEPLVQNIFTLKSCAEIPGVSVHSYEDEGEMLREYRDFILKFDPDIIIGYNICNFDFPYLLNRATKLNVKDFNKLSRISNNTTKVHHGTNTSKALAGREMNSFNIDGRIVLDMYTYIVKEYKLRSYTLNNVSFEFLGDQKEEVHYSLIYELWAKNEFTRRRIAVYCLKDAYLPIKLCDKLMTIYNYTEMCRVTCTPLKFILTRGQQIKVSSQLHKRAMEENYVVPTIRRGKIDEDATFEGAYVLDPVTGFYTEPIVTLDFASLMAHNLCYSTLLDPEDAKKMDPNDYIKTPNGDHFVKDHIRKGILPKILEELIGARKKAKIDLKNSTDANERAVLDGRQLALKISANSVYGFTGAQVGDLPCLQISASVTSIGREMIDKTRSLVLEKFNKENNYQNDSEVIYGDTDSVMIKFNVKSLEEAMKLGKESADYVSTYFKYPIKLEFEKVYYPYLLMKKKRYAGLIWTKLDKYDKIDTKGIESVRRDNCGLVKTMIDNVIKLILVERNNQKAIDFCKGSISDLLQNKVDLSLLIISKSISKKTEEEGKDTKAEKNPSDKFYKGKQAHVELAQKMKKREEGSAPGVGDRVQYVIVKGVKGAKNYEKSEDPKYVLDNDLEIDTTYYLENQLKKPLLRIFSAIIPNADQELFSGEHTKIKWMGKINAASSFSNFITVRKTCLSCKCTITTGAVCKNCKHRLNEIYVERRIEANNLQSLFNYLWSQCQRCQGSSYQEVICQNKDCQIYYKRFKTQKELKDSIEILARFKEKCEW